MNEAFSIVTIVITLGAFPMHTIIVLGNDLRLLQLFARLAELRAEVETTEREIEAVMDFVKDAIARGQPSELEP